MTKVKKLNVDEPTQTEELIKREDVENSPFQVITTEEGSFGVMGKYRLTEVYKDKKTAIKDLKKITWNRLVQVFMLLQEFKEEQKIKLTEE